MHMTVKTFLTNSVTPAFEPRLYPDQPVVI
jgi:hypothetical protein